MPVQIKRYANRKLYNTETSRYITLKGIAALIEEGETVRVVDNESGEDITSIALSQILVDHERNHTASSSVLTEFVHRGGDAIASAFRKRMEDASDGLEEIQKNMRRLVEPGDKHESSRLSDWVAFTPPDFDKVLTRGLERVLSALDLPSRKEIEKLNQNLEQVLEQLESLTTSEDEPPKDD